MTGRICYWREARFGVEYFSVFVMTDGLGLDGARILEKGGLQEVERGAVVPVGRFRAEK